MKIGRYLAAASLLVGFLIAFGNRGVLDNYRGRQQLMTIMQASHQLEVENIALKKNIVLLRNDLAYIEMIAREDLGMVKKGDLVYRKGK
jgi:cell division protein FtsB